MAHVLDAFIVEIGLDPSKMTKGQQQAVASFKRSQEQIFDTAKVVEGGAKRIIGFMSLMRTAITGFAAGLGLAIGINEMKDFFEKVTKVNAALGRMSRAVGVNVEEMSKWRMAVRLSGGEAEDADRAITDLTTQFKGMFIEPGQHTEMLRFFRALELDMSDMADIDFTKTGKVTELILRIATAGNVRNVSLMSTFFQKMGFSPGFINALTQGPDAIRKFLAEAERMGPTLKKDVDAATELERAWKHLNDTVVQFGQSWITMISPKVAAGLEWITEKVIAFRKFLEEKGIIDREEAKPGVKASGGVPIKSGAAGGGGVSLGVVALTRSLMADEPQLKEFTALNDMFHKTKNSKHNEGLAMDFSIRDPKQSEAVTERLRRKLAQMGIDAFLLNEYLPQNRSGGSTGPHIHMQFQSAMDAERYAQMSGARAAVGANGRSSTSTNSSEVHIGEVNVNAPHATDAQGIGQAIRPAWQGKMRRFMALSADGGAN